MKPPKYFKKDGLFALLPEYPDPNLRDNPVFVYFYHSTPISKHLSVWDREAVELFPRQRLVK